MTRFVVLALVAGVAACRSPTGQNVWELDVTRDGIVDRVVITDERDGFRNTFAYADIYVNGASVPVEAKWKDGRWVWIDVAQFPGLGPITDELRARDADRW